ncbi:MAG: alpha/beta fold hydrolase [Candidatus Obscuribacterales bacterium]
MTRPASPGSSFSWLGWKQSRKASLQSASHLATTDRGELEYVLFGSGPVVLTFHGTPGGYDQGSYTFGEFALAGFSVLSPSRSGYLRTPLSTGRSIAEQAGAFKALLDRLEIDRVFVAGVSGGGPYACRFALDYPDRVRALLLECPVTHEFDTRSEFLNTPIGRWFQTDTGSWQLAMAARYFPLALLKLSLKASSKLEGDAFESWAQEILSLPHAPAAMEVIAQTCSPASLRHEGIKNDFVQFETLGYPPLEQIAVPTMLVHGEADADAEICHSEYAIARIEGSRLIRMPGASHLIWLQPDWPSVRRTEIEFFRQII